MLSSAPLAAFCLASSALRSSLLETLLEALDLLISNLALACVHLLLESALELVLHLTHLDLGLVALLELRLLGRGLSSRPGFVDALGLLVLLFEIHAGLGGRLLLLLILGVLLLPFLGLVQPASSFVLRLGLLGCSLGGDKLLDGLDLCLLHFELQLNGRLHDTLRLLEFLIGLVFSNNSSLLVGPSDQYILGRWRHSHDELLLKVERGSLRVLGGS